VWFYAYVVSTTLASLALTLTLADAHTELVLPSALRTLRYHRGAVLGACSARRSYSAAATRKRSGGKGREVEKVITDITQHLADLDAEKRQRGGVDPKHVAAVLKMVWEGREHISEKGREGERLLRHLKSLRGDASGCSVEGFTDLISALAKFGLTEDCFAVFDRMKGVGLRPNEWTFSALIAACGPRRDRARAQQVFEEMRQREDLKPDAVTYTLLLKANEGRAVGEVKQAMQVLSEIKKAGIGTRPE
jgi:pentatricopeptide repeat protein